jgi:serine/threonine protein kinase
VTIVLADFGFAVSVDELSTDQTAADFRYGTVDYMSPELLPPDEPHYSSAGDVWAAGVVAFVAFAGCQPFHFPSDGEEALTNDGMDYLFGSGAGGAPEDEVISRRIRTEEVSFDSSDWEMASDDMKDFVKLVLTKDRRCRPSAVELLDHRWIRDESQILPKGEWEVGLLKRKSETETAIPRLSFTFVRDEPIGLNLRPGSLVVDSISPLTQAEEAGVKAGSIIVEVNWRSCTSVAEYIQLRALDPKVMQISVQETEVVEEAPSNADEVNITVLASSDGKEQTSPPPSAQIHVDRLEGADEDGDRMQIEAGQQGASPTPAQDDKSTRFKEDKRDGLGGSYSVIDETSTDDGQEESEDVPTAVEPAKCEQHTLAQGGMEAVVETTKLARPEARKEALRKAAHVQQEVSRVLALVQDLVRQADAIVTATGPLTAAE